MSFIRQINRTTLNYGTQPSRRYRRAILIAISMGLAISAWRWGPGLWRQCLYEWRWRQCCSFSLAPTTIVYEEDRVGAEALRTKRGDYHGPTHPLFDMPAPLSWVPPAEFSPTCLVTIDRNSYTRQAAASVAFIHQRAQPNGTERLVLAYYNQTAFGAKGHTVFLSAVLMDRGTPQTGVVRLGGSGCYVTLPIQGTRRLRLYAGQVDSADPTHFTIVYAIDGQKGTIDGWLYDNRRTPSARPTDGPCVEMAIRDGPAPRTADAWPKPRPRTPSTIPAAK